MSLWSNGGFSFSLRLSLSSEAIGKSVLSAQSCFVVAVQVFVLHAVPNVFPTSSQLGT